MRAAQQNLQNVIFFVAMVFYFVECLTCTLDDDDNDNNDDDDDEIHIKIYIIIKIKLKKNV